ncbi:cellulose binding domain-containing protein [Streptomyces sp. NPDC001288]|uniref:cellulose binding domain-containing protein n=2 Tax=unclassified Streptomyces TaxID=2593676 RepID=UPI0036BCA1FE
MAGVPVSGLPAVPRLLHRLHGAAAAWRSAPERASLLRPDYAAWLDRTGTPREQAPLGLLSLSDMSMLDAEMLWWSRVEALPADRLATALGWDPAYTARVLEELDTVFVEHCQAEHMENGRRQRTCRSYGGMLIAGMRRGGHPLPAELQSHLAGCAECGDLSACLNAVSDGTLGSLLASAALGWGGPAYATARWDAEHQVTQPTSPHRVTRLMARRLLRLRRNASWAVAGSIATAVVGLAAVTVAATLHGQAGNDTRARSTATPGQPVVVPMAPRSGGSSTPAAPAQSFYDAPSKDKMRPSPSASPGTAVHRPGGHDRSALVCTSRLTVDDDWGTGAKVELSVQSAAGLSDWQVTFVIAAGIRMRETWYGTSTTEGNRVTVSAVDYDRYVAAGGSLTIGMVYEGETSGNDITDVTLNKHPCRSV